MNNEKEGMAQKNTGITRRHFFRVSRDVVVGMGAGGELEDAGVSDGLASAEETLREEG